MADSPSSILLLRLQSTGSNVNLWGGYLNTALQTLERAAKGYEALAVTGDATISWSNYSASNSGAVALLKLTGSLTAAATLTLPGLHNFLLVWNAAGQSVTLKCSGGTGVTVPNGRKALLYCDGTDYYFAGPNYIGDDITEANNRDLMDKAAVEAAIAAASGLTAPFILASATDTTTGYLNAKLAVSGALTKTLTNAGSNETVTFSVGDGGLAEGGLQSASFAASAGSAYVCPVGGTITLPAATGSRRKIEVAIYGAGTTFLSGVINGQTTTTFAIEGDQTLTITDADATRGWV